MENHHALEPHQFCTIEEIHIRAETVTPLLKEILDHLSGSANGAVTPTLPKICRC